MKKIKVGIIGAGAIAQLIHLPILKKNKDVVITAICDVDNLKLKSVAKKFEIEKTCSDYKSFFDENDLDATFILTQTDSHKELALFLPQNCKNLFIEKPVALNYKDTCEIFENVQKNNIKLFVGMNMRYRPDSMMLKSLLEGGFFGETSLLRIGYFKPFESVKKWLFNKSISNNVVFDLGISIIDLALWFLNYPEIYSITSKVFNLKTNDTQDAASAFIKTKNDKVISLDISWSLENEKEIFYCNLFSEKGYAFLNPLRVSLNTKNTESEIVTVPNLKNQNQFIKSYENEINHFIEIVKGLNYPDSTFQDTLSRMQLVEAFIKSAKLNKEVLIK